METQEKTLKGIGGWLIFFIIRLIMGSLMGLALFIGGVRTENFFLAVLSLALCAATVITLVFLFKKNIIFRNIYVILAVVNVLTSFSGGQFSTIAAAFIVEIIWLAYLYKSVRVENTFI
jgi:type IV secretory pathway VirB3-like protein